MTKAPQPAPRSLFRAKTQDLCQYEVRYNQDWINDADTLRSAPAEKFLPGPQGKDAPSLQLILAWRNVPKHRFLYRLAEVTTITASLSSKCRDLYRALQHG